MAKLSKFSPASTHLSASATFLVIFAVVLMMGITVVASLNSQVFQGHASVQTFSSLAVKGNIYVDANKDKQQDNGEKNYTALPRPTVKAILFNQECSPTPEVTIAASGVPTPPVTCRYVRQCLGIACSAKDPSTCKCNEVKVCTPNGNPTMPIEASPAQAPQTGFGKVDAQFGLGKAHIASGRSFETNPNSDELQAEQQNDACRRLPLKVIDCPVDADGTYSCIATNVTFLNAMVRLDVPFGYRATTQSPVVVRAATATVNFGIYPGGPVQTVFPGTVRSFAR